MYTLVSSQQTFKISNILEKSFTCSLQNHDSQNIKCRNPQMSCTQRVELIMFNFWDIMSKGWDFMLWNYVLRYAQYVLSKGQHGKVKF